MQKILNWWENRQQKRHLKQNADTAVKKLIEESEITEKYITMCVLSGVVASGGIILADTSIIIAAMVLAPLLTPLLAIGAGINLLHKRLVLFSLRAFAVGFGLVALVAFTLGIFLLVLGIELDIAYFLERFQDKKVLPVLMVVSLVSGYGAVYTWIKNPTQSNVVGVAIAVALIPFVAYYGLLLATANFGLLFDLSLVLISNLLVIICGATLAFFQQGLASLLESKDIDQKIDQKEKMI